MKKYKIVASQTIYATYEIEIEADNEKQAEEKALNTYINDWDDERFENGDALTVDEIEEIEKFHDRFSYSVQALEAGCSSLVFVAEILPATSSS